MPLGLCKLRKDSFNITGYPQQLNTQNANVFLNNFVRGYSNAETMLEETSTDVCFAAFELSGAHSGGGHKSSV